MHGVTEPLILVHGATKPAGRARRRGGICGGLLRTARPRQWVKNVLVFAAPGAAGVLTTPIALLDAIVAFGVMSMAASAGYFLNDARDAATDRIHPVKRLRPVAAGVVPVWLAYTMAAVLAAVAVAVAQLAIDSRTAVALSVYAAVTATYSCWLQRVPVLEVAVVSSAFVLRAVIGALATGVSLSFWFVIVTAFAALFMVAGKRFAELKMLGVDAPTHRSTLRAYTSRALRHVCTAAMAVTVTAYATWAFSLGAAASTDGGDMARGSVWLHLSIAPFTLAMLRYGRQLDNGLGGAPEEIILSDRFLQSIGLVWAVLFTVGIHGH